MWCWGKKADDILNDLAKTNTLEKLELLDVEVTENTFSLIKSLDKLQSLMVSSLLGELTSTTTLPPNIKYLKLEGFRINRATLISLIKKLKYLDRIYLLHCSFDNQFGFNTIADFIVQSLSGVRRLNVIISSQRTDLEVRYSKISNQ